MKTSAGILINSNTTKDGCRPSSFKLKNKNKKRKKKLYRQTKDELTEDDLINSLIIHECLTNDEYDHLEFLMYNLGFGEGPKTSDIMFTVLLERKLDLHNPVHRGIMIGFLMQSKYNSLEP